MWAEGHLTVIFLAGLLILRPVVECDLSVSVSYMAGWRRHLTHAGRGISQPGQQGRRMFWLIALIGELRGHLHVQWLMWGWFSYWDQNWKLSGCSLILAEMFVKCMKPRIKETQNLKRFSPMKKWYNVICALVCTFIPCLLHAIFADCRLLVI